MDEVDRLSTIKGVRGVGPGTVSALLEALGGEEQLLKALREKDVGAISSVERVSGRMAVNMVFAFHGTAQSGLLANDQSREVHEDIVRRLQDRMHSSQARDRCMLLVPMTDLEKASESAVTVLDHSSLVIERERVESLLGSYSRRTEARKAARRSGFTIITEDEHAYQRVREKGLDRYCLVMDISDLEGKPEEDVIYVYNTRELDESRIEAVSFVSCESPAHEMLPEIVLDRFIALRERISIASELESIYDIKGRCGRAAEIMDALVRSEASEMGADPLRDVLEGIRLEVESSLKKALEGVVLSGKDTLDVLSGEDPLPLREIYKGHSRMAQSLVRERMGINKDLFVMRYPLLIDETAVEETISSLNIGEREKRFRERSALASELASMEDDVRRELSWVYDLDFRFGLGTFVLDNELNRFEVSDGWFGMISASHLDLRGKGEHQPVDYYLGRIPSALSGRFQDRSGSRIALLTGANSGGKSTLLETIAQVVIMAHMGLPVPSNAAFVPRFDSLHLYRPRRHMDAGGLEGFLREFLPLCLEAGPRSMVLADELEAMTEIEASMRIVRSFLKELEIRCAFAVVVTHLAVELSGAHPFRIDGIEAKGLDEGYNLIVDRTPRICYHARSMPELILKRLLGRAKGPEKELYARVLSEFTPPSS
jgi:DNA mismatch repair protein MutS2